MSINNDKKELVQKELLVKKISLGEDSEDLF